MSKSQLLRAIIQNERSREGNSSNKLKKLRESYSYRNIVNGVAKRVLDGIRGIKGMFRRR